MGTYSDKKVQIEDQFDDLTAQEKIARNGDTNNVDISARAPLARQAADAERRSAARPRRPHFDQDRRQVADRDPDRQGVRRAQDDRWLQGFYGNALTGEDGATVVPFKAANIVAVNQDEGGNAGITLNKLIYMSALMDARFSDEDEDDGERYAIITSKQKKDLLKLIQVSVEGLQPAADPRPAEREGASRSWASPSSSRDRQRQCLSARRRADRRRRRLSAACRSSRSPASTRARGPTSTAAITERDDKQFSTQIYAETCAAVTRTNEDKCFQMLCLES
jgi:hypothetical protein